MGGLKQKPASRLRRSRARVWRGVNVQLGIIVLHAVSEVERTDSADGRIRRRGAGRDVTDLMSRDVAPMSIA